MSSQLNAQTTETRQLPKMGVRYSSQSCRRLHRQDPDAEEPEPACDVTERDGDDCKFLQVNITRLLPFNRWSLCQNTECFGDDPDGIERGEGIETDGGERPSHYKRGDGPFPSAFPGIGVGAVLYEDRPDTPDDERRLYHVVDIRISTETTDVSFVVEDGTHTQRFHYHEEDLLADFAPAGWRWPTGEKPTYWLTRRCGVDDKMDLMTDGGIERSDGRDDPPENHVSVFPWPGGKGRRSDWIISRMPPHDCYVEVFGGSAAILYNKPRSHNEVYNDVNDDIVQFFEALRDRDDELAEWVQSIPYSRSLHSDWIDAYLDGYRPDDPIERAGRFWCLRYMQFAAKPFEKSGFKVRNYWNPARTFDNAKGRLRELANRFRAVTVENRDYIDILEGYDAAWGDPDDPDVLFYLDPPYVGTEHYYSLEFDHEAFVEALADVDGRWMCSYSELPDGLDGYHVLSRERRHRMTRSNASVATEHLVCNFDPAREPSFVDSSTSQQTLVAAIDGGNSVSVATDTERSHGGQR